MTRYVRAHGKLHLDRIRRHRAAGPVTTILAVAILAGVVQGCTSSGDSISTTTMAITARRVELSWGETARVGDGIRIVAYAPEIDSRTEPVYPGEVVLYCVIDITNEGSSPLGYHVADFGLCAEERTSVGGLVGRLTTVLEPPLPPGPLAPGETVQGAVAFELPEDQVPTIEKLMFHFHSLEEAPDGLYNIGWSVYWSGDL